MSKGADAISKSEVTQALDTAMSPDAWSSHFYKTPCVRTAYLLGIASSGLIMAHKLRLHPGNVLKAVGSAILTFGFTTTFAFVLCATDLGRRQQMIKQAMDISKQRRKDREQEIARMNAEAVTKGPS